MSRADQIRQEPEVFHAYWFTLRATGVPQIDAILKVVAEAGKASHHTEFWGGQEDSPPGRNYIEEMQTAADAAAADWLEGPTDEDIETAAMVAVQEWLRELGAKGILTLTIETGEASKLVNDLPRRVWEAVRVRREQT